MRVEFYGIPRLRAGVSEIDVQGRCLGDVLVELAARLPDLADSCIRNGQLASGCAANLGGDRFISDLKTEFAATDTLLILSADAGG